MPKKIVISGGPSSGKTSLIAALEKIGHSCIHEVSREITLQARQNGIEHLFRTDPLLFSQMLLEARVEQFKAADQIDSDYVFLDRGIPDVVAYLDRNGVEYPLPFVDACKTHQYDAVYILPPWKDIHITDNERYEDYSEAKILFEYLHKAYETYDYNHVFVPKGTIEERIEFILTHLKTL